MIPALLVQLPAHAGTLAITATLAPPPIDPTNLINAIFQWLLRILSAVAMIYFVIDLFKHIASSPRDLVAAGKDALVLVVLLAVAAKADVLVTWARGAL